MRRVLLVLIIGMGPAAGQEELRPPQPEIDIDDKEQYQCKEEVLEYEPVASYRISGLCEITNVQGVGEYQYGLRQIKEEIRGFQSEQTVKRFVRGESRHRKRIRIELHRARERPAVLVCETDMMENRVFEAKIVRNRYTGNDRQIKDEEPVSIEDHRLPDLGVFTHSRKITYTTDRCEE